MVILISACLIGLNCKYNGESNYHKLAWELVKEGKAIPVCPEQLGGLPTPRMPSEINQERRVITKDGKDVTQHFQRGAEEVLKLAKELNIQQAILKSKSPSCGKGTIYNGKFEGRLVEGNGITAQALIDNGIEVMTIEEYEQRQKQENE